MHGKRYMWITAGPLAWLVVVTFTAGYQKIFSSVPRIGFLARAAQLQGLLDSGKIAAEKVSETRTLIFNERLDALLCGIFMVLVATILVDSIRVWIGIFRGTREAKLTETPFVPSELEAEAV
jgi:carbon starvation protein